MSRVKTSGIAAESVRKENRNYESTTCDPDEQTARIVMSVLAGELSVAEAARQEKVTEQSARRLGEAAVELRVWKKSSEG